jgi:predicted NBD/HSP70 family sugar kinase
MLQLRDRLNPAQGPRAINRKQVLLAVMIKADTQATLARRTGLAQSTISNVVRELVADGIVVVDRNGQSQGAGQRSVVRLPASRNVSVGVHLGYSQAIAVARRVDQSADRTYVEHIDSGANRGLQEVLPALKRGIEDAVGKTGLELKDVISLGVAVPGMVDPRTGVFAHPVLPPWRPGDNPSRELSRWLRVPEALDNDANLGALAEQTYRTDGDAEMVVYIKASTGIGAGLVLANIPIRGHHGIAGEIGHIVLDPGGMVCRCGGRGCLETVIGADALVRQVREALAGRSTDVPHSLPELIERAQSGDAMCVRVLQDAGRVLGRAVAHLCNLLNPDLIVVGGQLSTAANILLDPCREALGRYALNGAVDSLILKASSLGALAEAQGALVLGLNALRKSDDAEETPERK